MTASLPHCPDLPTPPPGLDHRHLSRHGDARDGAFYLSCLDYAQALWHRALPARAVLCLDRAFGADLRGDEPELQTWPLPYAAMAWFLVHTPPDLFIGNPRVHFQHYADRMNQPRRELRAARAWACWHLARRLRPEWPSDPRHFVEEPSASAVAGLLTRHGLAGETRLWESVLARCTPNQLAPAAPPSSRPLA